MEKLALEQYRGDTLTLRLLVKDSNGDPVSLEAASVRFTLGTGEGALTEESDGVDVDVVDAAGQITVQVAYAQMQVTPDSYPFDVEVTFQDNTRRTLVLGDLLIKDDVTKREG
jgi:hypothetical protein